MLFNSWEFVLLVLLTVLIYYLPFLRRFQIFTLIFSSFIFYGYNSPHLLWLLVGSIFLNAIITYLMRPKKSRRLLALCVIGVGLNLLVLMFFKYSPLIAKTFVLPLGNSEMGAFLVQIPLPIGISFFTFQGISLVVDSYRSSSEGNSVLKPKQTAFSYFKEIGLFKSFFPQLVAGPIVKAHEFLPQISDKKWKQVDWSSAFKALILGYFLKMVVADNLKDQTFFIQYPFFEALSGLNLLSLLFGYSMQIFADFAGYSLIAIGLGLVFGYKLPINFDFPYISQTFSEFWRRWHISLSTFLKSYLYIPLGGNRKGPARTYLNLMIVMFLGGLWHGAAWSYAVWGSFHGLALAVERFLSLRVNLPNSKVLIALRIILVFSLVTFAWLLFKLPRFDEALKYLAAIGKNITQAPNKEPIFVVLLFSLPVILYHANYLMKDRMPSSASPRRTAFLYAFLLFFILVNSGSAGDFIYFQF